MCTVCRCQLKWHIPNPNHTREWNKWQEIESNRIATAKELQMKQKNKFQETKIDTGDSEDEQSSSRVGELSGRHWIFVRTECMQYVACCVEHAQCIAWKFNNSKWNKYKHELHAKRKLTRYKLDSNHVIIHSRAPSLSSIYSFMPHYAIPRQIHFDVTLWCDMATKLFCNIHFDHNLLWITIYSSIF